MEKYYPEIVIAIILFAIVFGPLFLKKKQRVPLEEITTLKNVPSFTAQPGDTNDDFEDYLCSYAEEHEVKTDSLKEIEYFMVSEFESIRLSYVYQTGKTLVLNDIPGCIANAAKKYVSK